MVTIRRHTRLKKEILKLLKRHHLLTAMQLIEKLHGKGVMANKTSVYRNLDAFLEENLVCRQTFGDEFLYELQDEHHDHIQCNACGKVEEVPCAVQVPSSLQGYAVEHHHLTLFGTCRTCRQKTK